MQNLELFSVWESSRCRDTYVHLHTHTYYELVYYPAGTGSATIGDTTYSYSPDTFFIIPPNVMHDETRHTDSKILCLSFACPHPLSDEIAHIDQSHIIYKILKDILNESIHQPYGYQDMILAKLNQLMIQIARMNASHVSGSKNFQYIINYLKENFHEKIQLRDCAKQLNISYDYFQHKFKEITGLSPQQFLIEQRLDASKDLLLDERLNCTEIAYRCGFSTSAQFSMLFKRVYHISPLQYRALKM